VQGDDQAFDEHLDLLGKVLLATGLMTSYGYVFEVFDALYSGGPHEIQTLIDRIAGAYAWTYWGALVFNFIPLQALWWRRARRSGSVLLLISVSVVVGMWLERYMILHSVQICAHSPQVCLWWGVLISMKCAEVLHISAQAIMRRKWAGSTCFPPASRQ
jgi:hypothetical protein